MKTRIKMRMLGATIVIMAMLVGSSNAQERDRTNEVVLEAKGFKFEFTTREGIDYLMIFVKDKTVVERGMETGFTPKEGDREFYYEWESEDYAISKKMPLPMPLVGNQAEDIKKSGLANVFIDKYTYLISDKLNEKIIKEANRQL